MKLFQRINGIKKKRIVRVICICMLFVAISNVFLSGSIVVYAWSAGGLKATIASIVVSMLMSSGAGITNMDWLSQLNSAYGIESAIGTMEDAIANGLLTESGGALIDTGLSDAIMANSAYTDLGLDTLFTTTADDIAIDAGTVVATGGANLAAEGIGAVTLGTVGQAVIAVGAGIALGVLANHFIEKYAKPMFSGTPLTEEDIISGLADGERVAWVEISSDDRTYTVYDGSVFFQFSYMLGNYRRYCLYSFDGRSHPYRTYQTYNNRWYNWNGYNVDSGNSSIKLYNWDPLVSNYTEYANGVRNGNIIPEGTFSPDVIGDNGNQRGTYDNVDGYNFPDIKPYYDSSENGLQPIPMDDYMDFARMANDNTEDGLTEIDQGDLFQDFINPYLMEQVPEVPEPEPDYSDPSVIPDQPSFTPKDDVTQGDIDDADAYTAPGLMERFPFCIPNDILAIFKKFNVGREAPFIEWNFVYDKIGLDYVLRIDFSEYDSAASVLRSLELIAFVVGLGVATRKLIGG